MLTYATFLDRGSEFRNVSQSKIEAALAQAARSTDPTVYGEDTEDAQYYLAAHILSADPNGKEARLKGEGFKSIYMQERSRLDALHCAQYIT